MKTTKMFRATANPRRTTLAHLKDLKDLKGAEGLVPTERPEHRAVLPTRTANPRRTILMDAPTAK
ncbi:hypothetical protein [Streptomyces sp. AK02-01A]|uniref:hypothetical protein n=1 Tax=Streptomyces sp. AK02-01A TaxID=3028648 RepID=UPI0029BBB768|nr:hypothetical protein [Streptomyces sp. AK02-01A]MDX3855004.1 hypothetical protein [Streptomyces sp. AK02-01A]